MFTPFRFDSFEILEEKAISYCHLARRKGEIRVVKLKLKILFNTLL